MARSRRIGHCVCDPRSPCPCALFREKNICTCAGEREPPAAGAPVRLTAHTRSAGCASKIGQRELDGILAGLPTVADPRILVGMGTADDAGVLRLNEATTLVQTVDVFTPTVDDPYTFGRIAACNSLSDIWAMGATPVTALSIVGFPVDRLPATVMTEMLRGGMDVLGESGVVLLGGHSLNDEEVKLGYAVTGVVEPTRVITNAGARPGDLLILTKPLGTGIVALALQVGKAAPEHLRAAVGTMTTTNRAASQIMVRHGATAATDVTGFGLMGHLARLGMESGVTVEVWWDALPILPGALEYARAGCYSGAVERNAEFSAARTTLDPAIDDAGRAVLWDPQTSGGLLMCLPPDRAEQALAELRQAGMPRASVIGRVRERSDGRIRVLAGAEGVGEREETIVSKEGNTDCCGPEHRVAEAGMQGFTDFLAASTKPGAVDVVTKELIAVALGLAVRCVPCARAHIKKAAGMGISAEEMEEAAVLAVAFSGCGALMLWRELKAELLAPAHAAPAS